MRLIPLRQAQLCRHISKLAFPENGYNSSQNKNYDRDQNKCGLALIFVHPTHCALDSAGFGKTVLILAKAARFA